MMRLLTKIQIFTALFIGFTTIAQANHWQGGAYTGGTDFGGTIKISENVWQWYPSSVVLNSEILDTGTFSVTKSGMLYQTESEKMFTILQGRTLGLISKPKPGIQPVVIFTDSNMEDLRFPVKGVLSNGNYRYGEGKLNFRHALAYQDSSLNNGWVSRPDLSDKEKEEISLLMKGINGYGYRNEQDTSIVIYENIFNQILGEAKGYKHTDLAGAWLTTVKDISVSFPGSEEYINQWQGWILPIVVYF
ncbi:hypothetical protein [Citrobacter sp. S-77]|uniref:hypothetical protein n=1 Tax=Citrobacter sp. S-77 TaxID=1080067 RepID=UPI0011852979|nr:hypothetical protein [Citrobacter sp. S-77]